jgi:DNA primase
VPAREFKVTHGERVMDKESGVTKLELVEYYALVGELMMEHLKGRPVSLVRAPEAWAASCSSRSMWTIRRKCPA